jgi:AmmeMemoRadiSam system protein B
VSRRVEGVAPGIVRPAAVAGSFYPGSADRLETLVRELYAAAAGLPAPGSAGAGIATSPEVPNARLPTATGQPIGLLVPHAGLAYSGVTAAAAWRQLGSVHAGPVTVVVLGTNHGAAWLDGVGAWETGAWRTPLGDVGVDESLAAAILGIGPPFVVDRDAHDVEHSIEVQLPLLRMASPDARIVPLAVSAGGGPFGMRAGERLGTLLGERRAAGEAVVLVISSDMAHYPSASACERTTAALLPALLAIDAAALADREARVRQSGIRALACGMCGIEPAVLGLAALRAMGATTATVLAASTSADAGGPPDRSVGYLAMRFDA